MAEKETEHHQTVTDADLQKKNCEKKNPLLYPSFVFQTLPVDACSTLVSIRCNQSQCTLLALPVNFTEELKNQEKTKGETVRLCCKLSKPVAVQWKKGSEYLTPGDKYEITQREMLCELLVKDLKVEDSGEYSCVCGEQKTSATVKVSGMQFSGSLYYFKKHFFLKTC